MLEALPLAARVVMSPSFAKWAPYCPPSPKSVLKLAEIGSSRSGGAAGVGYGGAVAGGRAVDEEAREVSIRVIEREVTQ